MIVTVNSHTTSSASAGVQLRTTNNTTTEYNSLSLIYGSMSVCFFCTAPPSTLSLERCVVVAKFDAYCGPATRMHISSALLGDHRETHRSTPIAVQAWTANNTAMQRDPFIWRSIGYSLPRLLLLGRHPLEKDASILRN